MTIARIAQDSTGRGGGGMVHVVSAVVAEWRTEIHNSRPIAALNIHGSLQRWAPHRGKVLVD
jgi:hypothetical protein